MLALLWDSGVAPAGPLFALLEDWVDLFSFVFIFSFYYFNLDAFKDDLSPLILVLVGHMYLEIYSIKNVQYFWKYLFLKYSLMILCISIEFSVTYIPLSFQFISLSLLPFGG